MIVRKNMGRARSGLMLLVALGFFLAAYNLVSMIIHNKASNSGSWVADGLEFFDPVIRMSGKVMQSSGSDSKFHVALTATDAAYSQWQCRIMYYWYKKVRDMPGSDMGKFTRILHSGRADQLMDEIPTFVVDPLPEGLDRVREFMLLLSEFVIFSNFIRQSCVNFCAISNFKIRLEVTFSNLGNSLCLQGKAVYPPQIPLGGSIGPPFYQISKYMVSGNWKGI